MAVNSFSFNSLNATTDGLTVLAMPPKKIPEQSGQFKEAPGRDGFLFIDDGVSKPIEMSVTFIFKETETLMTKLRANLKGEGKLRLSTEPNGYYQARVIGEVVFGYWLDRRMCTVNFIAQPYFYLDVGDNSINPTNGSTINNIGNVNCYPVFFLEGTGVVTITIKYSRTFSVDLGPTSKYMWVDSTLMEAYDTSASMNNQMTGEFPYLSPGGNYISWTGNLTDISLTPYFRRR